MTEQKWKQSGCMIGQVTDKGLVGYVMLMEDKYPSGGKHTHDQRIKLAERITKLLNESEEEKS